MTLLFRSLQPRSRDELVILPTNAHRRSAVQPITALIQGLRPFAPRLQAAPLLRRLAVSLLPAASVASVLAVPVITATASHAVSLDQACSTYAEKLNAAVASGDKQKAQAIYQQGRDRIASRFGGATCPNVKAPGGS